MFFHGALPRRLCSKTKQRVWEAIGTKKGPLLQRVRCWEEPVPGAFQPLCLATMQPKTQTEAEP